MDRAKMRTQRERGACGSAVLRLFLPGPRMTFIFSWVVFSQTVFVPLVLLGASGGWRLARQPG